MTEGHQSSDQLAHHASKFCCCAPYMKKGSFNLGEAAVILLEEKSHQEFI